MLSREIEAMTVRLDGFLRSSDDIANPVVGVYNNVPIYLRNLARISDGPEEPRDYVFFSPGPAAAAKNIPLRSAAYGLIVPVSGDSKGASLENGSLDKTYSWYLGPRQPVMGSLGKPELALV
jgi:hypothetical protein